MAKFCTIMSYFGTICPIFIFNPRERGFIMTIFDLNFYNVRADELKLDDLIYVNGKVYRVLDLSNGSLHQVHMNLEPLDPRDSKTIYLVVPYRNNFRAPLSRGFKLGMKILDA